MSRHLVRSQQAYHHLPLRRLLRILLSKQSLPFSTISPWPRPPFPFQPLPLPYMRWHIHLSRAVKALCVLLVRIQAVCTIPVSIVPLPILIPLNPEVVCLTRHPFAREPVLK